MVGIRGTKTSKNEVTVFGKYPASIARSIRLKSTIECNASLGGKRQSLLPHSPVVLTRFTNSWVLQKVVASLAL